MKRLGTPFSLPCVSSLSSKRHFSGVFVYRRGAFTIRFYKATMRKLKTTKQWSFKNAYCSFHFTIQ